MFRPLALALATLTLAVGCSTRGPTNPSFDLTVAEARDALAAMADDPQPLARPVVLLAGWADPGFAVGSLSQRVQQTLDDDRVIDVSFSGATSFDDARERVLEAVDAAFPSDDATWTQEVDVVAISMGGLVARHAAAAHDEQPRRLRIARLITLATPHQGARLAHLPTLSQRQRDMRPGSSFLDTLPAPDDVDYDIHAYVRLDDTVVGAVNAAPDPATPAWWIPNRCFDFAHALVYRDPRLVAEIARHLRGEPTWATHPPVPVPPPFRGRGVEPPMHDDAH